MSSLNQKMQEMLKNVEWGEFKLEDLFEINSSKRIFHANYIEKIFNEQKNNTFPYIVRTTQNNGIRGYISENIEYLNDENTLSFAQDTFSVFYQKEKYFTGNKVKVLKPKFENQNELIMKYFTVSFQKTLSNLSWGIGSTIETIAKIKISLPIKNGKIDFNFMEKFIEEIEKEKITKLEKYLEENDLKDCTLTSEEKQVLEDFENGKVEWGEFRLGDLFEKLNLKFKKSIFDKDKDLSKVKTEEYDLPLVNAKDGNNGIMYYGRSKDFESAEMCIDIVSDGAISTGNVYSQPQKTGVLYNAYLIKSFVEINKKVLHFFTCSIKKSIKLKFGYENKAGWEKVKKENIQLPVKNNNPDFEKMEILISAVEKLVVKKVVEYVEGKK